MAGFAVAVGSLRQSAAQRPVAPEVQSSFTFDVPKGSQSESEVSTLGTADAVSLLRGARLNFSMR